MNRLKERLKKLEVTLNLNQARTVVILFDYYGIDVNDEEGTTVSSLLDKHDKQVRAIIERDYVQKKKNQNVFNLTYDDIRRILDEIETGT